MVTRDAEGELRKLPIPLHYLYVFLAGALIGMLTITGMAGSYTRMLAKVASFNQLRTEKQALTTRYEALEREAQATQMQVVSLGSLANEVTSLYGLKTDTLLSPADQFSSEQVALSMEHLYMLRTTAFSGGATLGIGSGPAMSNASMADWMQLAQAPHLWPVEGRVTSSFGVRIDPFNGEGAYHSGVDIDACHGCPVIAPAAGIVIYADYMGGYGRMLVLDHGNGITTRFGHLSAFAVRPGQFARRGERIGYVGRSGRATGSHVHYEVRVQNAPVNPYKYLRTTIAQSVGPATGS